MLSWVLAISRACRIFSDKEATVTTTSSTPGKSIIGDELTRSLIAATDGTKAVGTAENLNSAKSFGGGAGRWEGEELDWAKEVTNKMAMQDIAGTERWVTPTPMPGR